MGRNFVAEERRIQFEGRSRLEFLSHSPGSQKLWMWQPTSVDLCECKNIHFLVRSSCLVTPPLMLLRLNWCDPGVWKFISCRWVFHEEVVFVVDVGTKQKPCCWCKIFVKIFTWICQSYDMNLSKLSQGFVQAVHGFVKTKLWNCHCCYIDLLKLFHDFVKVDILILYILPFTKQNEPEVCPRFLLKLLLILSFFQFDNNFYFSAQYFAAEQLFLFYVMVTSLAIFA